VALFTAMTEINTLLAQLASQIDDTHLAVGVEALSGASDVYKYVKAAATKTPGLKPVADQLGQLFQKGAATRRANKKAAAAKAGAK
jgi:ABC-type ATPase with predicted acetyltransferase domain